MTITTQPSTPAAAGSPPAGLRERDQAIAWTAAAIGTIWIAVVLISVFAPDSVTGYEHDRLALAAILAWIWGLIASRNFAAAVIRRRSSPRIGATARLLAITVIPTWAVATIVGVFGPELVTGTDPTILPISAILAPIVAMVVTKVFVQLITAFDDDDGR